MSDPSIQFVPAQPEDLEAVYGLCHEVAVKTPSSHWDDSYPTREILARDISIHSLYQIFQDGALAALIQIRPREPFSDNDEAEKALPWDPSIQNACILGRFCVSPALQNQGLGRRILAATMDKAKAMGYDGAIFYVVSENPIALGLYDSMGFHRIGLLQEYGLSFWVYEVRF